VCAVIEPRELGTIGEERAASFLRSAGMRIIVSNYRCRLGEIDLVAVEGRVVVFVEVKSKRGSSHGSPEEMITAAKRRRLTMLARWFLMVRKWTGRPARFDVVAIDWKRDRAGAVTHYRNAFPASGAW
jgi:putative endonuclease